MFEYEYEPELRQAPDEPPVVLLIQMLRAHHWKQANPIMNAIVEPTLAGARFYSKPIACSSYCSRASQASRKSLLQDPRRRYIGATSKPQQNVVSGMDAVRQSWKAKNQTTMYVRTALVLSEQDPDLTSIGTMP